METDNIIEQVRINGVIRDLSLIEETQNKYIAYVNEFIERTVREHAVPKLKGEITKGKLKWRGLRLVYQNQMNKTVTKVMQRDKVLGVLTENMAITLPDLDSDSLNIFKRCSEYDLKKIFENPITKQETINEIKK